MMEYKQPDNILTFEQSRNAVYSHELYLKDICEGRVLSYPVLRMETFGITGAFFLYPNAPNASREGKSICRPTHWLVIDAAGGRLLCYGDCRIMDFADTSIYPLEKIVDGSREELTIKQLKEYNRLLGQSYDRLREFAFRENITNEQKAIVDEYTNMLKKLTPAGLLPFYRELGSDFCKWLGL